MRSRTDRARVYVELALRAGAVALLAWALVRALRPNEAPPAARPVLLRSDALARDLAAASLGAGTSRLHVEATRVPDARERAWLRALPRAGGPTIGWSGNLPALALSAEPAGGPGDGARVAIAAPSGSWARIADGVGLVDSVRARGAGAALTLDALEGAPSAAVGGTHAEGSALDSVVVRTVVVLGRAAWETRFVAAALEEAGWPVALRTPLAPGREVEQGALVFDTARTAAVVALDSTAASHADAIARFVRGGGGVVASAEAAAALPELAPLLPGAVSGEVLAPPADVDSVDRASLVLRPVASLRGDAVPLERRGAAVAVAARRAGAGRAALAGYADTWRWRMSGGDVGAAAHRRWWSALVAGVAYRPTVSRAAAASDPAPLAALVDALGAPTAAPARADAGPARANSGIFLLAAALAMLLAEWVSRRLRGAP